MASFSLAIVAIMNACLYSSTELTDAIWNTKTSISFTYLFALFLILLISEFTKYKPKWYLRFLVCACIIIIVANIGFPYGIYANNFVKIKALNMPWGDIIYIPIVESSKRLYAIALVLLLMLIYFAISIIHMVIKKRMRDFYIVGIPITISIMAGIRDFSLDLFEVESIFIMEISFVLTIMMMGIRLAQRLFEAGITKTELGVKEKRWNTLLENIELAVVSLNNLGYTNYVNPYVLKITGYSKDEILGIKWIDNFIPTKEKIELENLINKGELPHLYQNSIIKKNGEKIVIRWNNVQLFDENGKTSGSIGVGSDITKKLLAEKELKDAYTKINKLSSILQEENTILKEELRSRKSFNKITGNSQAINYVLKRIEQVAETDMAVLLEGETGVGKELFANTIHEKSNRAKKPFIKINCAAIPNELLESELFGHVKGAFTGADNNRIGRFKIADGGTLFLDEIAELPLSLQPKILRALQEGEFEPVGSNKTIKTDVRIIAATNRILKEEIEKKQFREDLYYRLSVFPITIPPLRQRSEDIPELVNVFVNEFSNRYDKKIKKVAQIALNKLMKYSWPGNIRELQNVLERAVLLCTSDTLKITEKLDSKNSDNSSKIVNMQLHDIEKAHIIKVLKQLNWKIEGENGAAIVLGLNPSTLRSKMQKMDIKRPN